MVPVTPPLETAPVTPLAESFVVGPADFIAPVVASDEEIDRQEIARLAAEVSAEIDAAIAAIDAMSAPDVVMAPLALTDSESVGDWAPQTDVRTRGGVSGSGKGSDVSGGDEGAGGNAWASAEPATMMQRK